MVSEIADLLNIALKNGYSQEEIHKHVSAAVNEAYSLWVHDESNKGVEIAIDYLLGKVTVYKNGKEATPKGFADAAEQTVRRALIRLINNRPIQTTNNGSESLSSEKQVSAGWIIKGIFWLYNASYIFFFIVILMQLAISYSYKPFTTTVFDLPMYQVLILGILVLTPLFTVALVIKNKLQSKTDILGRIFFLFEAPVMVISAIAAASYTETIPAVWILILLIIAVPFVGLLKILTAEKNSKIHSLIYYIFRVIAVTGTSYISLLILFYLPIFFAEFAREIGNAAEWLLGNVISGEILYELVPTLITIFLGSLGAVTIVAIVLSPYIITVLFIKSLGASAKVLQKQVKASTLAGVTLATIGIIVGSLFVQPDSFQSSDAIKNLELYSRATSYEEKEKLIPLIKKDKSVLKEEISKTINTAYKYPIRKDDKSLRDAYRRVFGESFFATLAAESAQEFFNIIARPFIFSGSEMYGNFYSYYEEIFNESWYGSYYDYNSSVNTPHSVKVIARTYNVEQLAGGKFARVAVDEEYANTTYNNQEVIYEFSLPAEAVITDLKLGKNLEYTGQVAPRGAAALTYQREVNRQRDPALIEQTGPRQYRLRVFPVPGKVSYEDEGVIQQRVQYTYIVGLTPTGYPTPVFTKSQNVTSPVEVKSVAKDNSDIVGVSLDRILIRDPKSILCENTESVVLSTATASGIARVGNTVCGSNSKTDNRKIAIYYDASIKREKTTQWSSFKKQNIVNFVQNSRADIYFFNYEVSSKRQISDPVYFGQQGSLSTIPVGEYEDIIILTDKNFNISEEGLKKFSGKRLYIVYDSTGIYPVTQQVARGLITANVFQTNSMEDVIATINNINEADATQLLAVSPTWILQKDQQEDIKENELSQVLEHKLIQKDFAKYTGPIETMPSVVQPLHNRAITANIVTIYSSLIALVNEQQQQNLTYDSQRYDKFAESNSSITGSRQRVELPSSASFGFSSEPSGLGFLGAGPNEMSTTDIGAPSAGSYGMSSVGGGLSSIIPLFVIANGGIVVIALGVYGVRYLKNRKKK